MDDLLSYTSWLKLGHPRPGDVVNEDPSADGNLYY
jgi:hypothetical protein